MINDTVKVLPEETAMTAAEIAASLHGEAIEQLSIAIGAIEAGDIEARCTAVNLTVEIVTTLHLALDFDEGGETIDRLGAIYRFVLASLFRINIQNDSELADKVVGVLTPLFNTWTALSKMLGDDAVAETDPAIIAKLEGASRSAEAAAL